METIMIFAFIFAVILCFTVLFLILRTRKHVPNDQQSPGSDANEIDALYIEPDEEEIEEEYEGPTIRASSLDSTDIERCIPSTIQDSVYVEYLTRMHELYNQEHKKDYPIYKIKEKGLDTYLFVVFENENDGITLLVYEPSTKGRNTILFSVDNNRVKEASMAILRFFASNSIEHQRSKLTSYLRNHLSKYGVLKKDIRMHNHYDSWHYDIKQSPRWMVQNLAIQMKKEQQ